MDRWQDRVAVVTGASSGIGEAIVKEFVTAALRVVALGRRVERLQENRSKLPENLQNRVYPRKCDVTDEADVKDTFKWIKAELGGTDILVNNAGVIRVGNLIDVNTSDIDDVLSTNVKGLIYCTQAAYRSMKDRNFAGHIVHINSILGHQVISMSPDSSSNIYSASKFAVTAINETIRTELRTLGSKIKTTSISPGIVRTEIAPKELFDQFTALLSPEDIANAVLFAIATPPHVQIHELTIKPVGEVF